MTLHPKEQMQALFAARKREETDGWKRQVASSGRHSLAPIGKEYAKGGLRRSRSSGLHKTHLGHVAEAFAVNVIQLMSWLRGEAPEQTRTSSFKRVMQQAA